MKKNLGLMTLILIGTCSLSQFAHAAGSTLIDGTFTSGKTVIFATVTRVYQYFGRDGSSNYQNETVIKGTDSDGANVRLTVRKTTITDSQFDAFAQDCAKKASIAMASPSTIAFRYTIETGADGITTDATFSNSYIVTRSSSSTAIEARCSIAPANDTSSD